MNLNCSRTKLHTLDNDPTIIITSLLMVQCYYN